MKAGIIISLGIWTAIVIVYLALTGCSSMPSMKYCDKVEYTRDGSKITIHAECHAPVGGSIPGV